MPGKSKEGGGLEVGSAYKMKYNNSAFPFKSPLKHTDKIGEGANQGNVAHADAHNQKHADNPKWGEKHDGSLSKEKKE